jgi:hypothetical protein
LPWLHSAPPPGPAFREDPDDRLSRSGHRIYDSLASLLQRPGAISGVGREIDERKVLDLGRPLATQWAAADVGVATGIPPGGRAHSAMNQPRSRSSPAATNAARIADQIPDQAAPRAAIAAPNWCEAKIQP